MIDDRLYDAEEELKGNELHPTDAIVELPGIVTLREEKKQLRMATLEWVATGLAFMLILAGFTISYLRG